MKILLGITGSVAAVLTPKIQSRFLEEGYEFQTIVTNSALRFRQGPAEWGRVLTDEDEWNEYKFYRKVLHINLIKWADAFLVAPCTANTLAKMANGAADNLLTSCALAWNYNKPFYFAPSMNCVMFTNPATVKNLNTMINFGAEYVAPQEKKLFCGDVGLGAMADVETLIESLNKNKH